MKNPLTLIKTLKSAKLANAAAKARKGLYSTKLAVKHHAPIILTGVGTVGLIATGVTAYKAGKKVERTVERLETMREEGYEVTRREVAVEVAKDVAVPVLLGTASVSCFVLSYSIQNKRLQALSAALTLATEEHYRYRSRAREILDEETFKRLDNPTEAKTIATTDEDGNHIEKEVTVPSEGDFFGRWFMTSSNYVSDDPNYNIQWIRSAEETAVKKIMSNGTLLYSELMDILGFDYDRTHLPFGWTDSDYFFLEFVENMVYNERLDCEVPELYVRWSIPRNIYGEKRPILNGTSTVTNTQQALEMTDEADED